MDYQSIYYRLVAKHKDSPRIKGQTNDHHIIPESFAKIDNIEDIDGRWNRVHLPHREHFIAHLLLARIWKHHKIKGPKMARAFKMLSNFGKYNSKDFAWLKLDYTVSEETRKRMSESWKHRTPPKSISEEHKQKISKTTKGRKGKPHSEETRKKLSKINKGKSLSSETKIKIGAANKGKQLSEEHKQKIAQSNKGRTFSEDHKRKLSEAKLGKPRTL